MTTSWYSYITVEGTQSLGVMSSHTMDAEFLHGEDQFSPCVTNFIRLPFLRLQKSLEPRVKLF